MRVIGGSQGTQGSKEGGGSEQDEEGWGKSGAGRPRQRGEDPDDCDCVCVCVCVHSTSRGGRSLATPAYQGRMALVSLPLGATVNKIKSATLTLPSTQGSLLACLHPTFPRNCCSTDTQSRSKLQSSSLSLTNARPAGPCAGRSKPLSFAKSKSIG